MALFGLDVFARNMLDKIAGELLDNQGKMLLILMLIFESQLVVKIALQALQVIDQELIWKAIILVAKIWVLLNINSEPS